MAYFSNGSMGDTFQHNVCGKCANKLIDKTVKGCPVWDIHFLFQDTKENKVQEVLDYLITENLKCKMFRDE